jgi:very-short-patch-repair endonuclease
MANEDEISRQTREMLIENARRMRKTPTAAEALLWELLRAKQLMGFKFRRQHIIRTFIVDFYCPACKLVVEIDGPIHKRQMDYDREREANLCAMGYQILRFSNQAVINDIGDVISKISSALFEIWVAKIS